METSDPRTGRKRFTKRRVRFDHEKSPREFTFSCYRGFRFLEKERTRRWFVEALEVTRSSWPVDLWAWVLMPEHVHLIVAPREIHVALARFVGDVKEQVGRTAVQWMKSHAPEWLPKITVQDGKRTRHRFWQPGGGYDRNITDESTLLSMIDYIHRNPVRRGLVERPEDWEWSSARWYAGVRPVVVEMDATLPDMPDR